MPASLRDSDLFRFGEEGEHQIGRRLLRGGAVVSPLYQYKDHDRAPVLFVGGETTRSLILPDLTCWKDGKHFFVECKRKNRWIDFKRKAVMYGHPRGLETGFNLRHFRHYRRVQEATGAPLWVFFTHECPQHGGDDPTGRCGCPTGVFVAELSRLASVVREWDGRNERTGRRVESPLALFPSYALRLRWRLEELAEAA